MDRSTKLLVGAATFWPPVYIALFLILIFGMVMWQPDPGDGGLMGAGFIILFILHTLTILLSLGMTVFYVIHAVKNEVIKSDVRIMWILLFVFAGMVAEPIYWYMQVWNDPEEQAETPAQLAESRRSPFEGEFSKSGTYQPFEPPDWR